jgi:hypothetical protein
MPISRLRSSGARELTYLLVRLDKEYTERSPDERWEDYYASELVHHFSPD